MRLETRPSNIEGKGTVNQRELVRNALRMRPDRIIVGEVRGGEALADRTGVEDLRSLAAMLVQTEKLGTSLSQSLRVHSDSMRTKRRQRAEEAAAKTTIKLVFPLVFLLFPALFIVILGPGAIQILRVLMPVAAGGGMMPGAGGARKVAAAVNPAGARPRPAPEPAGAPKTLATPGPASPDPSKIRVRTIPPPPANVRDTGISPGFLAELACKVLYHNGVLSLSAIAERIALPVSVAGDVMEFLRRERIVEVKKGGEVPASTTFAVTDLGRERAREFLRLSEYSGPAPVPLEQYADVTRKQTVRKAVVTREAMSAAFEGVVLPPGMVDRLGPAMSSGRSIFLYGPQGAGKTFIAERLAEAGRFNAALREEYLAAQVRLGRKYYRPAPFPRGR